ncbi:MAG: CYTH domain-containing protein [Peptostreptococcales bacterium]|jgi:triphosphatase
MEVELKYKIIDGDNEILRKLHQTYHGTDPTTIQMEAYYYDTKNLDFFKKGLSVRCRKENNRVIANIKSKEIYEKGLFIRQECEKEIDPREKDKLDFLKWFKGTAIEKPLFDVLNVDNKLVQLVETIFVREKTVFHYRDSQLEAAYDKGYILAGKKRVEINELEIELLQGKKEDIQDFGENIIEKIYGLRPENLSKFARGIRLVYFKE